MSFSVPKDHSSLELSCEDADYTQAIHQQSEEQLFVNETLASSNCGYFLRSEPDQLSLYSITSGSPESIKQWDMDSNDTIWTLYADEDNKDKPQVLSLSNSGCLTWNIAAVNINDPRPSILYNFCAPNSNNNDTNPFISNSTINNNDPLSRPSTTTNFYNTSTEPDPINIDENRASDSSIDNKDIIFITVGSVFIFLAFGLACFCTIWKNKNRESRELYNKKSNKYINSGWDEDKNRESEADLDLHYGNAYGQEQALNTKESVSVSRSGVGHGSDMAKGGKPYLGASAVELIHEYGLSVSKKYAIANDSDTDDENNEIQENELGYFINNSQESYNEHDRAVDIVHGALMDLNNRASNGTVRINLSDISDESTSSDEIAEPEISDLLQNKDKTPTKVNKGGEYNKNKWGKYSL